MVCRVSILAAALCAGVLGASPAAAGPPLLLTKPTVSRTRVVFTYAGDLWIVERSGGYARRLTSGPGMETDARFSPDGSQVAYTGLVDGNMDIYVVPAGGGVPRRLTWHPGADRVAGWTPDGKGVLFSSDRASAHRYEQLFVISLAGGLPTPIPVPTGVQGSFSPDGRRLAYVPVVMSWQPAWKRYRGGTAARIWIANLADSSRTGIPHKGSNDWYPMWLGGRIYFLSDRSGRVALHAYEPATGKVVQAVPNNGLDLKSASAGPDAVVYEQFGALHLYEPRSGKVRRLDVQVAGDLPAVQSHLVHVGDMLRSPALSPTGARAAFEARGEILTVPAEKGHVRNLTRSPAVADRYPAWSPDGQRLAWFSDAAGEYALHIRNQNGLGEVRKIALGTPPSFFYSPRWSPDGTAIAYTDKRLQLWYVRVAGGAPVKVDTDAYDRPDRGIQPSWSPDSRWLSYSKVLRNHLSAVFVYSLTARRVTQVTDGMSDALYPVFDASGKYLYFAASTDIGPGAAWLDMSSMSRPVSRTLYAVVLRRDLPSPVAPESDDEKKIEEKKQDEKDKEAQKQKDKGIKTPKPSQVRIDLERLSQRTVPLPIPAENYVSLAAGKEGVLFLVQAPRVIVAGPGNLPLVVQRFTLKTRKTEHLVSGVTAFSLSRNGLKMLFRHTDPRGRAKWFIASTSAPPKPGEGLLRTEEAEVWSEPRAEWRQMYREVWRIERDFFYDPHHHGLDLAAAARRYEPWLAGLGCRAELDYLFTEMLGELTVGHVFVAPPSAPGQTARVGLLGPTSPSRTAATASTRSTTARAGTRGCVPRSRSRESTCASASTSSPSTAKSYARR